MGTLRGRLALIGALGAAWALSAGAQAPADPPPVQAAALSRGRDLFAQAKYSEALVAFDRAASGSDAIVATAARRWRVRTALRTAEFATARRDAEPMVAEAPRDAEALALHGDALWASGLFDEAESSYQAALDAGGGDGRLMPVAAWRERWRRAGESTTPSVRHGWDSRPLPTTRNCRPSPAPSSSGWGATAKRPSAYEAYAEPAPGRRARGHRDGACASAVPQGLRGTPPRGGDRHRRGPHDAVQTGQQEGGGAGARERDARGLRPRYRRGTHGHYPGARRSHRRQAAWIHAGGGGGKRRLAARGARAPGHARRRRRARFATCRCRCGLRPRAAPRAGRARRSRRWRSDSRWSWTTGRSGCCSATRSRRTRPIWSCRCACTGFRSCAAR